MTTELVTISVDRLRHLEEIEAKIPHLVEQAIKEYKLNSLKRLHEKDKLNPDAVAERARRFYNKNKYILNERRREKRKQAKPQSRSKSSSSEKRDTTILDKTKICPKTITFE